MSFDKKYHTEDMCDKCYKEVGKENLVMAPFLYLDMNDKCHEDVSRSIGYPKGSGYRQYYICKECEKEGV